MTSKPVPNNPNLAPSILHEAETLQGGFFVTLSLSVPCEKTEPSPLASHWSDKLSDWLLAVTGPGLQNAPLKRTTYKQMPEEMPRGKRKALYKHKSVQEDWWQVGRERDNWHCLDSSHQHRVSLYPPHTSLQIGEYMNILHCAQCHYQTGPCQNIPAPSQNISSSSRYSFEEINQEINDGVTSLEASFSPTPYLRYTNHDQ